MSPAATLGLRHPQSISAEAGRLPSATAYWHSVVQEPGRTVRRLRLQPFRLALSFGMFFAESNGGKHPTGTCSAPLAASKKEPNNGRLNHRDLAARELTWQPPPPCCFFRSGRSKRSSSLDWKFEGPAAPFLVLDKGYYKAEGLDVTIDTAGSLEPLNRIASGTYDMGSATSTR